MIRITDDNYQGVVEANPRMVMLVVNAGCPICERLLAKLESARLENTHLRFAVANTKDIPLQIMNLGLRSAPQVVPIVNERPILILGLQLKAAINFFTAPRESGLNGGFRRDELPCFMGGNI